MNTAIEQMLKNYRIENIYDQKNAMKEIMQEIVLCGLSRAGFLPATAFKLILKSNKSIQNLSKSS